MEAKQNSTELSALQKAAFALKEMRAKLDAVTAAQDEPIAIVGMSCRLPQADNVSEFWQLLQNRVNAVTEVPPDRWSLAELFDPNPNAAGKINVRHGGFIKDVDKFDARFFGIAPQEATKLDPQHRMLLELVWEALEHAGQAPDQLKGSQTGCFIGINQMDYSFWQIGGDANQFDVYSATSHGFCFAAGRVSYTLGLNGPCLPIDTACSSSLVGVHLAVQSLRSGECNLAIAGGVQLNLSPEFHLLMTKTQSLSPSGACKTFDASADGYILGEGCGIVILKRLSDAIANKDNILAVLRATGVKHSGASSGITVPNELTEEQLVRSVLTRGKVQPDEVDMVETHGTGTTLGDPIEVGALGEVFRGRSADKPLVLGAVKSNIGHLDAAAGVAGLIKTVLSLQNETIPPNVHFSTPSPHIDWDKCPMKVPTEPMPWPRSERPRIAGLSSFAITGTMAHALIQEAPLVPAATLANDLSERPQQILTLSAKTPAALSALAESYATALADCNEAQSLRNFCFTANSGRAQFNYRLAALGDNVSSLQAQLKAYVTNADSAEIASGSSGERGQKAAKLAFVCPSQVDLNQAASLFASERHFKTALQTCQQTLNELGETAALIDAQGQLQLHAVQPAIAQFAVQYGLAKLWQAWGVQPAAVIGEGVGEYVAAHLAGVCELSTALQWALAAGDANRLQQVAKQAALKAPKLPVIAQFAGLATALPCAATADVSAGVQQLAEKGFNLYLSLGGAALAVPAESVSLTASDWTSLLNALAQIYVRGLNVDWQAFDAAYPRQRMPLPTYPFQRQRFWLSPEDIKAKACQTSATPAPAPTASVAVNPTPSASATTAPPVAEQIKAANNGHAAAAPASVAASTSASAAAVAPVSTPAAAPAPAAQGSLSRIMAQQLQMAQQTVSQVVAQQLSFLQQQGFVTTAPAAPAPAAESKPNLAPVVPLNTAAKAASAAVATPEPQAEPAPAVAVEKTANTLDTDWQLLTLAAESAEQLEQATEQLAEKLSGDNADLAQVAKQSHAAQGAFRRMTVANTAADAAGLLKPVNAKKVFSNQGQPLVSRQTVFMLPGVGDQYLNMASGLYQHESVFRAAFDECASLLDAWLPENISRVVYPEPKAGQAEAAEKKPAFDFRQMLNRGSAPVDPDTQKLNKTLFSQPAVFCLEYALAKLWMHWGFPPSAMIGYSLGEYVAACLSGVMSLADSLRLVVKRAQLIETQPNGVMLAVPKSEADLLPLLGDALSICIISTPTQCVVGGAEEAISELESKLKAQEVMCRRLQTTHAFHSKMLTPIKAELAELVGTFSLSAPSIPFVSNVTGTWITAAEATDPQYWARHTCETVRFADGMATLLQTQQQLFLEVGAGQSLGSFVLQHPNYHKDQQHLVLPSLRTVYDKQADESFFLNTLGRLWLQGVDVVGRLG